MMSKTSNRKKYWKLGVILVVGFFFLPFGARAATTIYFDLEEPTFYEDDIFLANLKISTPDRSINVLDGTILYDSNKLEVVDVSTGGSVLILWPKLPVFDNSKGTLSFVGGVTQGFQGEEEEVLKIIFRAKSVGEARIDFLDGFSVFLHDGQGTQINPGLRPLTFHILERPSDILPKDEWQDLILGDKTPPLPFEVVLGQDDSVFEGKKFLSFNAVDEQSGVKYYEVKEGDLPSVRSDGTYVLENQDKPTKVIVTAVDGSGNTRESVYEPKPSYFSFVVIALSLLLLLILIAFKFLVKKRKNGLV